MRKMFALLLAFSFLLLASTHSVAQEKSNSLPPATVPTKVMADGMTYDAAKSTVIFTGNVEIERADMMLWADVITVYLDTQGQATNSSDPMTSLQSGEVDRIVAINNVRMKYRTNTGHCGKAIYEAKKSLLIMQEDPVLKEGVNSIAGEEIRYYMAENRSEVIGGSKRVEAIFSGEQGVNF